MKQGINGLTEGAEKPRVQNYSQLDNPEFEAIMALRTAAKEGAFFLPHLRQGMRVLDVGCGPGSITVGLAEAVGPGDVVGIDLQASQVTKAQALQSSRGITNLRFEVGDANQLPFADGTFDAIFANSVLGHLRKPKQALEEMHRVLRPGGIVGVRDLDWGARIHAPTTPLLDEWYSLTIRIRRRNGGNPFLGREHLRLLLDAGFETPKASVSVWSAGTREEIRLCASFLKAQLQGFASAALAEGWMDQTKIDAVATEIDIWAGRKDSFYMDTYCEALARVHE